MQIRYIVSTMLFWWRENHLSFEQECEFLKSQGFGVELWPTIKGHNECRYERRNWSRLRDATDGMLVVMRSRNDSPSIDQWREQIECAKLLDASIVTDLKNLGIPDLPELNGCDFSEQVVKMAEENEVKLCLETGNLAKVKQVGKKFKSILYCLDTGYAHLDQVFSFEQYVDELSSRVAHIHLSDNYGQTDDHQPPGLRGGISRENWDYLLKAMDDSGSDIVCSFEMRPSMPAVMMRQACEFMFDELQWPDRPQKEAGRIGVSYNPV